MEAQHAITLEAWIRYGLGTSMAEPKTTKSLAIGVLVLNYNNASDTIACVKSIAEHDSTCSIFVIDNCSTDDSVAKIERALPDIPHQLLIAPANRGYAAGNNLGMRCARDQGCDYLCILNNDTIVTDDSISKLAAYLECDDSCSIAGPAILEFCHPEVVQSAGATIDLYTGWVASLYQGIPFEELPRESYSCGYIGGACMMVRASDLEKLGYMPENYFLFFEETEWCYRASRHVGPVKCVPTLSVLHKGSATIAKEGIDESDLLAKNRIVFEYRNASALQFAVFTGRYLIKTVATLGNGAVHRLKLFRQALREAHASMSESGTTN